ncbi:hypothetical protein V2K58_08360 [Pseudomonas alliivorans]|nr:hypothetical protein [Pseudomonas alliivorans]
MPETKERPILFSAPMVRAILAEQRIVCSNGILCQSTACEECGGNGSYKSETRDQSANQYPEGKRERFQKWVLSIEHPVKGWLDGHWLKRGDDGEGYADEYVQGLWVAFKALGAQQGEPAAWQAMAVGKDGEIYRNVAREGQQELTLRDARFAWGEGVLERFDIVIRPLFAQPATAKVVLPERLDIPHRGEFESANQHAAAVGEAKSYNACLDEVAKLNNIGEKP